MIRILIISNDNNFKSVLSDEISIYFPSCIFIESMPSEDNYSHNYKFCDFDLMFFDLSYMQNEKLEKVYQLDHLTHSIVYLSDNENFVLKAMRLLAFDFLIKPIHKNDIHQLLIKFKRKLGRIIPQVKAYSKSNTPTSNKLMVWENDQLKPLDIGKILKIKSDGAYSQIFLQDDKKVYTSKNLGVYESILKDNRFVRIHNSCLVNTEHIKYYKPGIKAFVTLSDSKIEYVSKSKKKELLKFFSV